jgi:hypothetical protein
VSTGSSFVRRMVGAAALRAGIYEEVEADRRATGQALVVVLLSGAAAAVGSGGLAAGALADLVTHGAVSLAAWVVWAVLTYQIGARLFPESRTRADVGELLRTLGFAAAPGLLLVFGAIPGLTVPVFGLATAWMLLAMIVAVRQALDYSSTGRAVAVCVLGYVLTFGFLVLFGFFFGPRVF